MPRPAHQYFEDADYWNDPCSAYRGKLVESLFCKISNTLCKTAKNPCLNLKNLRMRALQIFSFSSHAPVAPDLIKTIKT